MLHDKHKKEYGVYHCDTFDNVTLLVSDHNTVDEAKNLVSDKYSGRINCSCADRVDIVDQRGNILMTYNVS